MKRKLTINNQTYEVEIENINARPVVVTVDGQRFEIMPGDDEQAGDGKEAGAGGESKPVGQNRVEAANPAAQGNHILAAPLPGTVVEIFIKPGEQVEAGQVVMIIEAMKMKNSIRSVYSGAVDKVLVSAGQSVAHKQALIHFAE